MLLFFKTKQPTNQKKQSNAGWLFSISWCVRISIILDFICFSYESDCWPYSSLYTHIHHPCIFAHKHTLIYTIISIKKYKTNIQTYRHTCFARPSNILLVVIVIVCCVLMWIRDGLWWISSIQSLFWCCLFCYFPSTYDCSCPLFDILVSFILWLFKYVWLPFFVFVCCFWCRLFCDFSSTYSFSPPHLFFDFCALFFHFFRNRLLICLLLIHLFTQWLTHIRSLFSFLCLDYCVINLCQCIFGDIEWCIQWSQTNWSKKSQCIFPSSPLLFLILSLRTYFYPFLSFVFRFLCSTSLSWVFCVHWNFDGVHWVCLSNFLFFLTVLVLHTPTHAHAYYLVATRFWYCNATCFQSLFIEIQNTL